MYFYHKIYIRWYGGVLMFKDDRKRDSFYEEEVKKESRYRLLSDLERYEIFNTE